MARKGGLAHQPHRHNPTGDSDSALLRRFQLFVDSRGFRLVVLLAGVALVTLDYLRDGVGAVEAVWVGVIAHLRDLFQMAAALLNLIDLLVV